ncbi:two-component system LytT family sensor kinase [Halopolyspora algeriensis]|uniref:Two-component system LytT family sensor kinase n=2 Tax=Halopolyspora algeriensis TaxID=1500506 RepID=A0A368VZ65_9ACTN|nr:histidine kinase [Halopolyspora algeriensis]RCW46132.1 two-component system LytT family sensor kinase [Halopolyspora algeriensis]TQM55535.1 two-component system LytT family sensor kinase [Halopolyspora algeriensis]
MARRVAGDLKDGLSGPRVPAAARDLRRLLGTEAAVGLGDLSGRLQWAGHPAAETTAVALVDEVLHTETRRGKPPLTAVPLHVHTELAGVLVVAGPVGTAALREVTGWVEDALERGRLESSAEQAAQAELRALRAQISPHFVYNALTVIAALVRSDPDRARELMLDFADHARYSLAGHTEYTTVADEFHAIETYLTLQRAMLGDRLRIQVRVAPEVLAVAIPHLVLQPLVENAVRHGIEPHGKAGLVQVRGEAEGTDLVISVDDDGVGMDPATAEAILAGRGDDNSVGLTNVDRRLRTVYGPWFGLVVETAEDAGTRVVVRVPLFQPGVMP